MSLLNFTLFRSVSSVNTLEAAKVMKGCLYIAMPVQEVKHPFPIPAPAPLTTALVRDVAVWQV